LIKIRARWGSTSINGNNGRNKIRGQEKENVFKIRIEGKVHYNYR